MTIDFYILMHLLRLVFIVLQNNYDVRAMYTVIFFLFFYFLFCGLDQYDKFYAHAIIN